MAGTNRDEYLVYRAGHAGDFHDCSLASPAQVFTCPSGASFWSGWFYYAGDLFISKARNRLLFRIAAHAAGRLPGLAQRLYHGVDRHWVGILDQSWARFNTTLPRIQYCDLYRWGHLRIDRLGLNASRTHGYRLVPL